MDADLILVGGGLANCLIAHRLRALRPDLQLLVLEQGASLGGNHTWSFHGADVTADQLTWLQPFLEASWSGHEILFPERERRLPGSYHTIFSERFDARMRERLGDCVMTDTTVATVEPQRVSLADGRQFTAPAVIDGRGNPGGGHLDVRFQKFLGLLVRLEEPAGPDVPVLMDARLPQEDGFRFMYTLPLGPQRLLIEDTRYSDTPKLDREHMRTAIREYADARGWKIAEVLREEEGALPVVLGGDLDAFWSALPGVPRSGIRAGLFHYTTGYSLPEAVRLADDLAALPQLRSAELAQWVRARSFRLWRRGRFFRLLNRMLFMASEPEQRYVMLQYFYRLPADLVDRFYSGALTRVDKLRVVTGHPPVKVSRALSSMFLYPPRGTAAPPPGDSA